MDVEFFGADKSAGEYEALALQRFKLEQVRRETALFRTKWFDYRPWHFVKATYYLAHCYRTACLRFLDETKGVNRGSTADPFGTQDIFGSRELGALLTLRQTLDEHGIRYEWAMRQVSVRFADRGWRLMPRPNQLYGDETILDLVDAWRLECAATLQIPDDPRLRIEPTAQPASQGIQGVYARWVIEQVRKRSTSDMAWMPLSTLLRAGVLSHRQIEAAFGADQLRRARLVAER